MIWGWGTKTIEPALYFTEFIGCDLQVALFSELSKRKFFSVQADATTDAGNVEVDRKLLVLESDRQLGQ